MKKLTLEEIREFARTKGGKCLSENYKDRYSKLTWECEKGHVWDAPINRLKGQGSWCPKCARLARAS
jgi:hypothetical protein